MFLTTDTDWILYISVEENNGNVMMHAAIDLLIIVIDCIYDDDVQKKIKSKKLTKTPKFPLSSTPRKFQVSSCIHVKLLCIDQQNNTNLPHDSIEYSNSNTSFDNKWFSQIKLDWIQHKKRERESIEKREEGPTS